LLEVSKDVLRKWIIKVVGNDKRTGREANGRGLFTLSISFGVSLDLFHADVRGQSSL